MSGKRSRPHAAATTQFEEEIPLSKQEAEVTNTPNNYLNPDWDENDRVHNWRNYIGEEVQVAWDTFTVEQKAMLARQAENLAGREDWD